MIIWNFLWLVLELHAIVIFLICFLHQLSSDIFIFLNDVFILILNFLFTQFNTLVVLLMNLIRRFYIGVLCNDWSSPKCLMLWRCWSTKFNFLHWRLVWLFNSHLANWSDVLSLCKIEFLFNCVITIATVRKVFVWNRVNFLFNFPPLITVPSEEDLCLNRSHIQATFWFGRLHVLVGLKLFSVLILLLLLILVLLIHFLLLNIN